MKPVVLGIAGSLRNARWGAGHRDLIESLSSLGTEEEMREFLVSEGDLHVQQFIEAGRAEGESFDKIHSNLRRLSGSRGLSNSEIALSAALWAAVRQSCEIRHVSLAEYFPSAGKGRRLDELEDELRAADAILLSTPVYFGDRGSPAQALVQMIRNDAQLRADLEDKVYAGISVGAKRNGGQETTLVYQLLDMIRLGLLGVGNDSDTTSQYGGTGKAGDVGTMAHDDYGLNTSLGVGRRIAHVASLNRLGHQHTVKGKLKIAFWILQDRAEVAHKVASELVEMCGDEIEPTFIHAVDGHVTRCIACDICPTHIGVDHDYRCIIKAGGRDQMSVWHDALIDQDAFVPVIYSSEDREGLKSNYQTFIERTRYLRRGDYAMSDNLTAPLIVQDLAAEENMALRAMTSTIRHHTVLSKPMVLYRQDGVELNRDAVETEFRRFVRRTRHITAGRLGAYLQDDSFAVRRYVHVGYYLAVIKDEEEERMQSRGALVAERHERMRAAAELRLTPASS